MRVIVRPRQMGKTTDLIKYAAVNDFVIVTHSYQWAKDLDHMANKMNEIIRPPICVQTFKTDMKCNDIKGIVIDNADLVLQVLLDGLSPIHGMTISGVPDVEYDERKDAEQFQEFQRYRPDLTFQEFSAFKYDLDWE